MTIMPRLTGKGLLLVWAITGCASQSTSRRDASDPAAPNVETQQVSFELVKTTLTCFQSRQPTPGKVVMGAEFSTPGTPIQVFDSESTPGNEDAIRCAIERGS